MTDNLLTLIEQLQSADEWPEPQLLEAILLHGDDVIDPLRSLLQAAPDSWPAAFAIRLLASLNAHSAIPDFVQLYRIFNHDILEFVSDSLALLGSAIIEPVLVIVQDTELPWYARAIASHAALSAAGSDPVWQNRVAASFRELLAAYLARDESVADLAGDDYEMVSSLVSDLAGLADPEAQSLIAAAFEADIVDSDMIDLDTVERIYRHPDRWRRPNDQANWLAKYHEDHRTHLTDLKRQEREARQPQPRFVGPSKSAPKPGRNDPCWCGSGKKYKQCHWQSDQAA
jgi:hypothetical protein